MQVGAVLWLSTGGTFEVERVTEVLAERIGRVPRLSQRLVRVPFGCGRPVWVDARDFDPHAHMHAVTCPPPGGDDALLRVAADAIATPLPMDRPLWSATFVTDIEPGTAALVIVIHHVLADGIGGLAVLANLVDEAGAEAPPGPDVARPMPSTRQLILDAASTTCRWWLQLPGHVRAARDAARVLRAPRVAKPTRCSLEQPTGPRRRLAVLRCDVERIHAVAHAHGATVNDLLLAAITPALRALLRSRGEPVDRFVVSVPVSARSVSAPSVSARSGTNATDLGNQVGVMPVEVPATGEPFDRLRSIAEVTRAAKAAPRGASASLMGPVFRLLARLGLFRWFIERQRLVHTFFTNLRGPDARYSFAGLPVTGVAPVALVPGNVTVSFAALSYAGTMVLTVVADPDACPDLHVLVDSLRDELDRLTTSSASGVSSPTPHPVPAQQTTPEGSRAPRTDRRSAP